MASREVLDARARAVIEAAIPLVERSWYQSGFERGFDAAQGDYCPLLAVGYLTIDGTVTMHACSLLSAAAGGSIVEFNDAATDVADVVAVMRRAARLAA